MPLPKDVEETELFGDTLGHKFTDEDIIATSIDENEPRSSLKQSSSTDSISRITMGQEPIAPHSQGNMVPRKMQRELTSPASLSISTFNLFSALQLRSMRLMHIQLHCLTNSSTSLELWRIPKLRSPRYPAQLRKTQHQDRAARSRLQYPGICSFAPTRTYHAPCRRRLPTSSYLKDLSWSILGAAIESTNVSVMLS
ncbi:hypothetical protein B0H14DRAFT_2562037 [Mycena olivaceomarginata]|nr:hypothetical protein B0H14DRAFT_2562037 [Mycena olivaceomarginata]